MNLIMINDDTNFACLSNYLFRNICSINNSDIKRAIKWYHDTDPVSILAWAQSRGINYHRWPLNERKQRFIIARANYNKLIG